MTNPKIFGGHQDGDLDSLGRSPKYKAYHEVYITQELGPKWNQEVIDFVDKHITEYKGKPGDKHGLPTMLFERKADAQRFAKDLGAKLNISREHITVKAQKFTR
jgi:hypothetical protein